VKPRFLSITLLALALAACSAGTASPAVNPASPAGPASVAPASQAPIAVAFSELQVYAAASLKKVLDKARTAYEAATPGVTLTVSTDSSSALETKIEQGAPADVFLSADTSNPEKLVDGGFAAGDVTKFAANTLTVIVPTANPAGIARPVDLAKAGVKVIACADGVPLQKYTAGWLDRVRALPAYGADFPARLLANIASKEDNVGAIVTKVGLGEGDAGIVYVTDARTSDKVTTIAIPDDQNVAATYGGVVVRTSRHADAAAAFLAWLAGADGQAILAAFGFLPPS
jgi:molybdate transport system substrate-binding protein